MVGRNAERLNKVAAQIKKSGKSTPLEIVADVTKDAERIVEETIAHFGKLDVLVNNAGIGGSDCLMEIKISEFDSIFDTNLRSTIILTQKCVPYLKKTKGNIVNVSSILGQMIVKSTLSYSISKSALNQFTKCTALELAEYGVRVNAINPAAIRTPIFETVGIITSQQTEEFFESLKTQYPLGRVGEVSDTSNAIAFLANNKISSFITGILMPIDAGVSINFVNPL